MPQIKQTCAVTNNSQQVVISGVDLTLRIKRNHIFMVDGLLVPYAVASDSTLVDGNTVVVLSGFYVGATNALALGVFVSDYTYPDMIPTLAQGDVGTAAVFSQAMYRIQDMVKTVAPSGLVQYTDIRNDCQVAAAAAASRAAAAAASANAFPIQFAQYATALVNTQALFAQRFAFT